MAVPDSELRLLERVAQGDSSAVRGVIDRYGDLVWSLALRFTGSEAEAEEAVHEVFVMLWRKAERYDRAKGAEATFVAVVARRLLIDRWRSARRRPIAADVEGAQAPVPARDAIGQDETVGAAAEAFEQLDQDQKVVLRLSIERGYSHGMIADITGWPLGTVKTRIRTGLQRLKEIMEQHAPAEAKR